MEIPRIHPEQRPRYEMRLSNTAQEAIQYARNQARDMKQILTPGHILVGLANADPEVYERAFDRYGVKLVDENILQKCQDFIPRIGKGAIHGIGGNAFSAFENAEREARHSGRKEIEIQSDDLLIGTFMQPVRQPALQPERRPAGSRVELFETHIDLLDRLIGREGLSKLRMTKMLDDVVYISEMYRTTKMLREKRTIGNIIQENIALSETSLEVSLTVFVQNPNRQFSTKVGVVNRMRDAFTPRMEPYYRWQEFERNKE